jgi:hypothetical protein
MPLTCNPLFNYPYHEPCYFRKIKTNQTILDCCSYRVTVRRTILLHVAGAAAEAYRTRRMSLHRKFRRTQATNLYESDYLNSNNQNIQSVPSKKIVSKNNIFQVSSTSFILTTNDPLIIS